MARACVSVCVLGVMDDFLSFDLGSRSSAALLFSQAQLRLGNYCFLASSASTCQHSWQPSITSVGSLVEKSYFSWNVLICFTSVWRHPHFCERKILNQAFEASCIPPERWRQSLAKDAHFRVGALCFAPNRVVCVSECAVQCDRRHRDSVFTVRTSEWRCWCYRFDFVCHFFS